MSSQTPATSAAAFLELVATQVGIGGVHLDVRAESWARGNVSLRLAFRSDFLRPGEAISGPILMTLADTALFAAIVTEIGLDARTVTSELHTRFLRRAGPGDLIAHARLVKVGGRLATGVVEIESALEPGQSVALATGSFSVPRRAPT